VLKRAIVIVAAGCGRRFGGDKMSAMMGETTVLEASVDRLREALPGVPVIVVVGPSEIERWRTELAVAGVIAGGKRRQDSVRAGVEVAAQMGASHVVIHDGARPAVHPDDVLAVVRAAEKRDGAILSARVPDTIKMVAEDDTVIETIGRDRLRLAQTPQVFPVDALEDAWAACDFDREWSDEAALLEAAGRTVQAVESRHPNPKITTPADLDLVRVMMRGR
jgi:2-C-methyl-D-erythritol 4-phosphate cytidylyltransferase